MSAKKPARITLIGAGTIGLSFAALHLQSSSVAEVTISDPRPDIKEYIVANLPSLLIPSTLSSEVVTLFSCGRLKIQPNLELAVKAAEIVQEQGPENAAFKQALWPKIETAAPSSCLFWSSTSGIPASVQALNMIAPERLIIVHPYNPPHIMPLLEIVPSISTLSTNSHLITQTVSYWRSLNREPIILRREITGFVANRLAFALLREAIHLVKEGVVSVEECDRVVEMSIGPRWAVAGPFRSYHAGGGDAGLEGFMKNIGGTVRDCWDDLGNENVGKGEAWEKMVYTQTREAYGDVKNMVPSSIDRNAITLQVLEVARKKREVEA